MTGTRRRAADSDGEAAPNTRLDDLLGFAETPAPAPPRSEPWIFRAVMHTAVASVFVYLGFLLANLAPPYVLILVVCACAVLIRRAVQLTGEPTTNRTADVIRPPTRVHAAGSGWPHDDDGMRGAVRRWDRRLEWGATGPERYRVSVAGRLAELADERLRQRHGFTPAQDPARARGLIGDETWQLLYGPGEINPTAREISAAVQRLESL